MPYLSIQLDNFSTHDIQVNSEEDITWLGEYLDAGEVIIKGLDAIGGFFDLLGNVAIFADDKDWDIFDIMLNNAVTRKIVKSANIINSITLTSVKNEKADNVAVIDIDYKESEESCEYEESIKEINLMLLKSLEAFSLNKLHGNYFSGSFCFEVEICSENELDMKFVELNW